MYWTLGGVGLKVMAEAFGFSLEVPQAFTVLGLQVLGAMIPAGPGMTGPMQVYGRGLLSLSERVAVERDYVENLSIGRDLRILGMTLPVVLGRRGAY